MSLFRTDSSDLFLLLFKEEKIILSVKDKRSCRNALFFWFGVQEVVSGFVDQKRNFRKPLTSYLN